MFSPKQSSEMLSSHADSWRLFGNEFQDIGPATAKARRPNVLRRWRGTTSWRRLADVDADDWRRQRRTYSSPPGTGGLLVIYHAKITSGSSTLYLADCQVRWSILNHSMAVLTRTFSSEKIILKFATDAMEMQTEHHWITSRKLNMYFLRNNSEC